MKKIILSIVFSLSTVHFFVCQNQKTSYYFDKNSEPREHTIDVLHMRVSLSFDPSRGIVKGNVTHVFTPLLPKIDSIVLDAVDITIKSVIVSGKNAKYSTITNEKVIIYLPEALSWKDKDSIILTYEATPRKGLYFIGWKDPKDLSRKQIWSQGQSTDNRHWIPMYDEMNDKYTSEFLVKFNKEYKVLSNGKLLGIKENTDGTNTWHYMMTKPHAPYLNMIAIGKYDIKETKSKSGVPMSLYYYPEWANRVESTYLYSEHMMDFFEEEIGIDFPWESYSQVPLQDYMFGAMENTTATVFGDFLFVDDKAFLDRNYISINAHELAHQWFGNYVTARSEAHHWLQESFATYYNQLYEKERFGDDFFNYLRRSAQKESISASKHDNYQIAHSDAGTTRHYPKGAFVLHMLKYVVGGSEPFNKAIKHYLTKHGLSNVDSHDLLIAFHESLGISLNWFWDEWVYKGGEPSYEVKFKNIKNDSGPDISEFIVTQTHAQNDVIGLFKMPIWFEVHYEDGTMDRKMYTIEKQNEIITIANNAHKKISYVLFDPNNEILKKVAFDKPFDMLVNQASKGKHMLDRLDAVIAMDDISLEKKRESLLKIYESETFFAVKSEIIKQLLSDKDEKSISLIKNAINDKDVRVRRTIVEKIDKLDSKIQSETEKLLADPSYEIVEIALEKLCDLFPSKIKSYLDKTKDIEGIVGKNVLVKWLEIAYTNSQDGLLAEKIIELTSNSYEFKTRVNAFNAIQKTNVFNKQVLENLIDALFSGNKRLSNPAKETIAFFYEQNLSKKIIKDYLSSKTWADWQKEQLNDFL